MENIVMFSGGVSSWAAAKRVVAEFGGASTKLLFIDVLLEDEDLHRFITEAADNVGAELVCIAEGRDPWQVFFDRRFLGNTRVDLCSRILKREFADKWIIDRYSPEEVTVHVGIDWTEEHRFTQLRERKLPYVYKAPLCNPPYVFKDQQLEDLRAAGIEPPRLYGMGFAHNNCGGFCVKAGQGHFARLLHQMPDRYAYHERREQEFRKFIEKDVSILRDRTGGSVRPLTLMEFRERLEAGGEFDQYELGGCGCLV